jgi:hypothetical protein
MSDDERLAALFRDAASDAPPAAFGHDDVVATSRRITARRRTAVVAAAAVVGLVGLGAAIALPQQYAKETSAAAAPVAAPEAAGGPALDSSGSDAANSSGGAAGDSTGGPGSGSVDRSGVPMIVPVAPPAASTPGCADPHDAGLRALVVQVLPEVAAAPDAPSADVCLPPAQRYLSVEIAGDVLAVSYYPPGSTPALEPGALSAPAGSGGTVVVSGPEALADRLPALLELLAARL